MRLALWLMVLVATAAGVANRVEAQNRIAVFALDLNEWSRLSEAQQGAYIVGAITIWTIHGLRCPSSGSTQSPITWRSLRDDIAAEAASLAKTQPVETALIRVLYQHNCLNVLPGR